jgi:predicted AAA+ superfamily ATPase
MFRHSLDVLQRKWLAQEFSPPLLLRGARQVGKTWLARELGRLHGDFIEVNLEEQREVLPFFEKNFSDPCKLLADLSAWFRRPIDPKQTLLFIDEIQESQAALSSLRYFKEKMPSLRVVATGSLLEFRLKELSFPVGRIDFYWVQPMNFEEFLLANSINTKNIENIDSSILKLRLHEYFFTGGLPEAVLKFTQTQSIAEATQVVRRLAVAYRADFPKHSKRTQLGLLQLLYDSLPRHWGKKIKYSSITSEFKARELSVAMLLLEDAGLLRRCLHTAANGVPLSAEAKLSDFKLFSLDIGVGLHLQQLSPLNTTFDDLINKGGVLEQFIAQELCFQNELNQNSELFFWHRAAKSATAEVDFMLATNAQVVPVEVKSGRNQKSKSLRIFMEEKQSKSAIKVVLEGDKIEVKAGITRVPAYYFFRVLRPITNLNEPIIMV